MSTPATQNEAGCPHAPRLPHKIKVNIPGVPHLPCKVKVDVVNRKSHAKRSEAGHRQISLLDKEKIDISKKFFTYYVRPKAPK